MNKDFLEYKFHFYRPCTIETTPKGPSGSLTSTTLSSETNNIKNNETDPTQRSTTPVPNEKPGVDVYDNETTGDDMQDNDMVNDQNEDTESTDISPATEDVDLGK